MSSVNCMLAKAKFHHRTIKSYKTIVKNSVPIRLVKDNNEYRFQLNGLAVYHTLFFQIFY